MKRLFSLFALLILAGAGCSQSSLGNDLGGAESGAQWIVYGTFEGFQTNVDATKLGDGASPNGQNTTPNEGDRVSIRDLGYDLFPDTATYSTTSTEVGSLHTFRRRDGENIFLRAVSTTLEWYDTSTDEWETLKNGYTSDDFGFADNNINSDQSSYVYFGNGAEPYSRWTGAHTNINGAVASGTTLLTVDDVSEFDSVGTIAINGTEYDYTSASGTYIAISQAQGIQGALADNESIAQAIRTFPQTTFPRGNILLFADNRVWVSGVSSTSDVVYFTSYGSSTDFGAMDTLISDSTDASAGLFNLAEGGGAVTAMVMDEQAIYIFKRSIIYKATLNDTTYSIYPLKTFDQKSQTTGAINKRSTFASGNGIFFLTPDNQIMWLQRIADIDYPQVVAASDAIKETVDGLNFNEATGIVYRDKAFFALKSDANLNENDTVLVLNLSTQQWDTPIIGWNVGDWAIYQDSTIEELYFGDGVTANVYLVNDTTTDYIYDVKANWRTKQFSFGVPQGLKYIENVYVEGYISQNTDLTISLLLDEDGFTQTYSTTLKGTESAYIYDSTEYNVFGFSPFGTKRFGSDDASVIRKKFRVYLGKEMRQIPSYTAQLEFASEGENQQWEITNFGFLVRQAPQPEKRELFHNFK